MVVYEVLMGHITEVIYNRHSKNIIICGDIYNTVIKGDFNCYDTDVYQYLKGHCCSNCVFTVIK